MRTSDSRRRSDHRIGLDFRIWSRKPRSATSGLFWLWNCHFFHAATGIGIICSTSARLLGHCCRMRKAFTILDSEASWRSKWRSHWSELRLKDRIRPGLHVLFVGINPGVRSAITGHHFAGYSNRFWKLLSDSRLAPEPITYEDDDRLPEWDLGLTNLIARPSPGIDDLRPAEYLEGWKVLDGKIRRYRPGVV